MSSELNLNTSENRENNADGLVFVNQSDFDPIYTKSEDEMLKEYIERVASNYGINLITNMIPAKSLKKRKRLHIYTAVWCVLLLLSLFMHSDKSILFAFAIAAVVLFFKFKKKDTGLDYIASEVKNNPKENISTVIHNAQSSLVPDTSKRFGHVIRIISVVVVMVIFFKPRMEFEYDVTNNGYYVSDYTAGVFENSTIRIPKTYDGKPVVGIRGEVFNNLYLLKKVYIPDTVVDIRGHAFENDKNLESVDLPVGLTRIGGSAFAGCSSLKKISIPDTVTEMEGETFKGCSSLKTVELSSNITEIRGNTFENCSSLQSIDIPAKVTRIAAHSFTNDTSLTSVTFAPGSVLNEIGSSAFRNCTNLRSITLPNGVSVNEKAFKESPTKISYME